MRTVSSIAMTAAVAAFFGGGLAGCGGRPEKTEGPLVIRDGEKEWRFVPVKGESRLMLSEIMMTEEGQDRKAVLSMPLFWISEKPVSEGDFAAWTGRKAREGRSAEQSVAEIEWEEALACCEMFTKRYASQLPRGVFATLPTSREWTHAVKVLDYPDWLDGETGTFLFTRNQEGGFLCSPGKGMDIPYDLANTFVNIPKRDKREYAGLRMVLADIGGGKLRLDGQPFDDAMVTRGALLAECGFLEQAKNHLEKVLSEGNLSPEQRERAKPALEFARQNRGTGFEDWSSFVTLSARAAEKKGFEVQPFAYLWSMLGSGVEMENEEVAEAYAKTGIWGEWVAIGDLPEDVREHQSLGETHSVARLKDDGIERSEFKIGPAIPVQVLRCDFTGDGVEDMVVETFGSVGSAGYWYDFFAGRPDGSHVLCESLQTVGLCAIPKSGGGACGFLHFGKVENPVLAATILTFREGKAVYDRAVEKDTAMIDAFPDRIYAAAPFIGAGYGLGWAILEGRGVWYRPLFWPWKNGEVQGLAADVQ